MRPPRWVRIDDSKVSRRHFTHEIRLFPGQVSDVFRPDLASFRAQIQRSLIWKRIRRGGESLAASSDLLSPGG